MKIIHTDEIQPADLHGDGGLWIYNGLDCCVTTEVLDALLPQLTPTTAATYQFSRDLQGPILEMNMRGMLVDQFRRDEVLTSYHADVERLTDQLNRLIRDGVGFEFEVSKGRKYRYPSDDQLKHLFFNIMGLPKIHKINGNGERVLTVDRKALEKLEHHFYAEPIVRHLYSLRELAKKISFLNTGSDPDGRLRTSFNIAGTTTGRLASSMSDFGTGTNLQNVENRLRSVFIADPGHKFCNIDLEQGDSRGVGAIHWNLFRDSAYLDACESGDLHTNVAVGAFPSLPWTGKLTDDRLVANGSFHRDLSFRDAAKRLGHGTNYRGNADHMARETHIPSANVHEFQRNYLKQFPSFKYWWEWVEGQVRDTRKLTTLMGRQRYFFGNWRDHDTINAAVAYEPQSITADTIDRGLFTLWRANRVQLLLQVHDSILFQFPEEQEEEIVPWALETIKQRLILKEGREFVIPGEAKVGWNWSDYKGPTKKDKGNPDPDALRKFTDPTRPKTRTRKATFHGF